MIDNSQPPNPVQVIHDALASIQPGSPEASEITAHQLDTLNARESEAAGTALGPLAVTALEKL